MMNLEKILKNPRLTSALTGFTPNEFNNPLPTLNQKMRQRHNSNPDKQRKFGGGRKGFLKTTPEKLFFTLFYYKCYPTYDVLASGMTVIAPMSTEDSAT